jgi:GTPase SAR1 family protein
LVEKRERMALILGDKGTGKTTLAKKFTKYTMDRGGFNDCI